MEVRYQSTYHHSSIYTKLFNKQYPFFYGLVVLAERITDFLAIGNSATQSVDLFYYSSAV